MAAATVCFLAGTPRYRHQKPAGSPAKRILQVFVAAIRNRKRQLPDDNSKLHEINMARLLEARDGKPYYLLRHTTGMRFFDKAAVIEGGETESSPWRLCTVTQVEELKGLLRFVPIAMSTTPLYMVLAQVQTWTIQQSYAMERRVIGARSSYLMTLSAIAIAVVLLEVAAYDFLRRITGSAHGLSHLRRIGTGLALSVVGLAYAALLEFVRLGMAPVPLSVFWQLPILVAMGSAIFFAHTGLFEFFYNESPARMRSLGAALSMVPIALGLFQNGGFLAGVNSVTKKLAGRGWLESQNLNHNRLDYFYLLMAALSSINLVVFLITARFNKYKQFINAASNSDDLLSLDN